MLNLFPEVLKFHWLIIMMQSPCQTLKLEPFIFPPNQFHYHRNNFTWYISSFWWRHEKIPVVTNLTFILGTHKQSHLSWYSMVYKQLVLEEDHWLYCPMFMHFSVSALPDNISSNRKHTTTLQTKAEFTELITLIVLFLPAVCVSPHWSSRSIIFKYIALYNL